MGSLVYRFWPHGKEKPNFITEMESFLNKPLQPSSRFIILDIKYFILLVGAHQPPKIVFSTG